MWALPWLSVLAVVDDDPDWAVPLAAVWCDLDAFYADDDALVICGGGGGGSAGPAVTSAAGRVEGEWLPPRSTMTRRAPHGERGEGTSEEQAATRGGRGELDVGDVDRGGRAGWPCQRLSGRRAPLHIDLCTTRTRGDRCHRPAISAAVLIGKHLSPPSHRTPLHRKSSSTPMGVTGRLIGSGWGHRTGSDAGRRIGSRLGRRIGSSGLP